MDVAGEGSEKSAAKNLCENLLEYNPWLPINVPRNHVKKKPIAKPDPVQSLSKVTPCVSVTFVGHVLYPL